MRRDPVCGSEPIGTGTPGRIDVGAQQGGDPVCDFSGVRVRRRLPPALFVQPCLNQHRTGVIGAPHCRKVMREADRARQSAEQWVSFQRTKHGVAYAAVSAKTIVGQGS